ncbi:MAG: 2-oxoglutarate dehydrogenase, E2 component, dihydrolipoamide succinyltransferase [Planctomycetota bacterium]|nr:2-oxoglutarate dehydrogenase, E2 component, dihydrolipoamide succinyltransferase [Planctomycetota bacterium]
MAIEVKMPQMGESIAEGTLTRWFKKQGDKVTRDEPLFEISTDKVDAEVPAPADGILEQVLVAEGTTVEVNTVVALLGDGSASGPTVPDTASVEPPPVDPPVAAPVPQPVETPVAEVTPTASADSASGHLIDVPMPQMGESIAEGTLTRWFKKTGDSIERDEPLFEISTDKVDAEVPAPANGVLAEILVAEGTTVEVSTIVARIGTSASSATAAPVSVAAAATPPAPPPVAQPHVEVAASASPATNGAGRVVRSSPLVRKIAREHGITDLSIIPGTGAGGRVTKNDILGFIDRPATAPASPAANPAAAPAASPSTHSPSTHSPSTSSPAPTRTTSAQDGVTVEKMSVMRRKIAEHMIDSKRTSAHVHSVFEADMTQIVSIRASKKDEFLAANGTKLTFMPFFLKACSDALRLFPHVNASIDGDEILVHHSVNIGIAVALENGLIVPVIKGVQDLSILGMQKAVSDLANRARGKQLLPDEVAGGTFTITNPGQFGGLFGIPIINQPQVAILGIGGIEKRPVVIDGDKIGIRDMTYMCLSYDHRLVDGALADQFMAQVKKNLESFEASSVV